MEAQTVAKILVEEVIARFLVPISIQSDQGKQFESALFTEMCTLLQIAKTRTTPYHPKSDGMVERFSKILANMLRMFVNDQHRYWDKHLPYVMMAYRSSEHEKKKVREKSRECHNHKPQPFPDIKRKGKPINPNKHKSIKRTKSTKISSLFPKAR